MTPRQRQAARLRAAGLTWAQVGERMGIPTSAAYRLGEPRMRHRHAEMKRLQWIAPIIEAATWITETWDAAETARVAR